MSAGEVTDGRAAVTVPRTPPSLAELADERLTAGPLTLRPWEPSDVAWVYDACQDAEIRQWTSLPSPYRATDAVALLERSRAGRADGSAYRFAVTRTDTDELLGAVTVARVDATSAEIGGWVASGARRQGVASAALAATTAWALDRLGLERVHVPVAAGNITARRVVERVQFRPGPRETDCRPA